MDFSPRQLDALKELANVGSGHAATALSKLLGGMRVAIDPPRAEVGLAGGLFRQTSPEGVVAALELQGSPSGALLFALSEDDARELSAQILGRSGPPNVLTDEAKDALSETANIVASAYLGAVAMMVGMPLIPSTPTLTEGGLESAAQDVSRRVGGVLPVVLDVRFAAARTSGDLWLLLAKESALQLLKKLHVMP